MSEDEEERPRTGGGRFTYNPAMYLPKEGYLRENWQIWLEQHESVRIIEGLDQRTPRVQYECFLMALGPYGRSLVKSFGVTVDNIGTGDDPLAAIKKKITERITGKISSMINEQELLTMKQNADESHHNFIKRLQTKANECTFGIGAECQQNCKAAVRERMTILRLIMGGKNRTAAKHIAMKTEVTLDEATALLNSVAASEELLKPDTEEVRAAKKDYQKPGPSGYRKPERREERRERREDGRQLDRQNPNKCQRCGGHPHSDRECPAKSQKCHNCEKMGHFSRVCRQPRRPKR
jgi:hypothetical protein